jgi:hypothetical protein
MHKLASVSEGLPEWRGLFLVNPSNFLIYSLVVVDKPPHVLGISQKFLYKSSTCETLMAVQAGASKQARKTGQVGFFKNFVDNLVLSDFLSTALSRSFF